MRILAPIGTQHEYQQHPRRARWLRRAEDGPGGRMHPGSRSRKVERIFSAAAAAASCVSSATTNNGTGADADAGTTTTTTSDDAASSRSSICIRWRLVGRIVLLGGIWRRGRARLACSRRRVVVAIREPIVITACGTDSYTIVQRPHQQLR